jgi:two-component system invasion response regulator UvrY
MAEPSRACSRWRFSFCSPALVEHLIDDLEREDNHPPREVLSNREFEVMRLIASGKTVGEIAELLSLSDKTISTERVYQRKWE